MTDAETCNGNDVQDIMDGAGEEFIAAGFEEAIDLEVCEEVDSVFFARTCEAAFTINVNHVYPNTACVRILPEAEYVKFLIEKETKLLILKPCDELDPKGYKWAREKNGKRYPSNRTGPGFVLILCKFMDWNPDHRHKIFGRQTVSKKGEEIIAFDLLSVQHHPKPAPGEKGKAASRLTIPDTWNGSFGQRYKEGQRTLRVDTIDKYTVLTVQEKKKKSTVHDAQAEAGSRVPDDGNGASAGLEQAAKLMEAGGGETA